jgi:hypothetical protein
MPLFPNDPVLKRLRGRLRQLSAWLARNPHAARFRVRNHRKARGRVLRAIRGRKRRLQAQGGKVVVLSGANRPGVHITAITMQFLGAVAHELGGTVTVSTGTNHNRLTTTGNVSDHWDGHAGDCGISWNNGDKVASAALRTCGWGRISAWNAARRGGLYNCSWKGHRVQVIWKTYIGGNHYNHVHLGCR